MTATGRRIAESLIFWLTCGGCALGLALGLAKREVLGLKLGAETYLWRLTPLEFALGKAPKPGTATDRLRSELLETE